MSGFGYDVLGFGSGAGVAGPEVDDEFNRTSFLSHFDGVNNGVNNAFDDGSASNHTITANGGTTQGSFGPFARPEGEWSINFDNSSNSVPYFAMGANGSFSGDFTIEAFFNANSFTATNSKSPTIIAIGDPRLQVYIDSSSKFIALSQSEDQASQIIKSSNDSITLNTWHHVAFVRSGSGSNNVSLYLDGTRVAQATNTATLGGSSGNSWVANSTSDAGQFGGNISNLRVIKGTAQYSGSSITVPTSGLTNVTNCVLLIAQSNRFVDNGANSLAISFSGQAGSFISAFGPFLTDAAYDPAVNGASGTFPNTYGGLTVPDSSDFTLGNTFTIEAWIYPDTSDDSYCVQAQFPYGYAWFIRDRNQLEFYNSVTGARHYSATTSFSVLNQWTHIAYVCAGGTAYHYINGVRSGSSASMSVADISTLIHIGINGSSAPLLGFISDYRMVVGTAVYSGTTYTIPTAPLTAITNTKLLLNMANGQAIDSTAQNFLTFYGNAKLSTGQAKFGDTSLYFNGSGDIARIVEPNFRFRTGDFTVEFWFYGTTVVDAPLLDMRLTGGGDNQARLAIFFTNNSGNVGYYVTNSTRITSNITVATNTWTHIALVRSSAVTRFYFNGTQDNQTYSDTIDLLNSPVTINKKYNSSSNSNVGYYDDIRISNMARYTSSFTAPTKPFPDQGQLE